MHLMFEQGIRGGIYQSVKRYDRINLLSIEGFNENKSKKYLSYFNCVNFYGKSMFVPYLLKMSNGTMI